MKGSKDCAPLSFSLLKLDKSYKECVCFISKEWMDSTQRNSLRLFRHYSKKFRKGKSFTASEIKRGLVIWFLLLITARLCYIQSVTIFQEHLQLVFYDSDSSVNYCKSGNIRGALIFANFAQNSASANSKTRENICNILYAHFGHVGVVY